MEKNLRFDIFWTKRSCKLYLERKMNDTIHFPSRNNVGSSVPEPRSKSGGLENRFEGICRFKNGGVRRQEKCAYHEGEKGREEGPQQVPGETKPDGDVGVVVVVGARAVFDAVHSELVYSVRALVYEATHRWAAQKRANHLLMG